MENSLYIYYIEETQNLGKNNFLLLYIEETRNKVKKYHDRDHSRGTLERRITHLGVFVIAF